MVSFLRRAGGDVARDAARLMRDKGDQAFTVAGEMSWREDAGLLHSPRPGHWARVQAEVGRRTGRSLPASDLRITAASPSRAA
ncbi:MAG TPA: hypothetical protein VH414_00515 [Lichenihabitans sp.]|nr:hypothetical protein [Lichenihabitans sp.]